MDYGKYFLIGIVLFLAIVLIGIYNRLVQLRNGFKNAFSQIDVQLKRRYDLIPNLVETAKGYMKHERETLEAVIQARNQAISAQQGASANPANAQALKNFNQAESHLTNALGRMSVVFEQYPDLKANQNMAQLMEELSSTENRIAYSRQAFNDAVMAYNNAREVFPAVMFANSMGFTQASLLDSPPENERQPVQVKF